jgi:hypothetical protein
MRSTDLRKKKKPKDKKYLMPCANASGSVLGMLDRHARQGRTSALPTARRVPHSNLFAGPTSRSGYPQRHSTLSKLTRGLPLAVNIIVAFV